MRGSRREISSGARRGGLEFALCLPTILLVIVMGIFDFGLMFQHYEVVTNAAREGASRVGVLPEPAEAGRCPGAGAAVPNPARDGLSAPVATVAAAVVDDDVWHAREDPWSGVAFAVAVTRTPIRSSARS